MGELKEESRRLGELIVRQVEAGIAAEESARGVRVSRVLLAQCLDQLMFRRADGILRFVDSLRRSGLPAVYGKECFDRAFRGLGREAVARAAQMEASGSVLAMNPKSRAVLN